MTGSKVTVHRRGSQNAIWVTHDDAVLTLNSGDVARLVENIEIWELEGSTDVCRSKITAQG